MPYAILTFDKPGSLELRTRVRPVLVEYLKANAHRLLAAGALIEDDGTGGMGGVILLDTDVRAEAELFIAEDPFTKAGLFASVSVARWRKAFFDGKALI